MLVLSRKINETILIGADIEVVVLGVEGETVKVGIRAPRSIDIYRKELYDSIRESNRQAVQNSASIHQLTSMLKFNQLPTE